MRRLSRILFLITLILPGPAARAEGTAPGAQGPGRELVILTLAGPTTYREGPDGPAGFEHDMVTAFARSIGARARFVLLPGPGEILDALTRGEGDIGAGGLIRREAPGQNIRFGPPYQTVRLQVACGPGGPAPVGVADLAGRRLVVPAGSVEERVLSQLRQALPAIELESMQATTAASILAAVSRGKWDCTLASSALISLERRRRPGLKAAFDLGNAESLAWALRPGSTALEAELRAWLERFRASGGLEALIDRHYGFIEDLSGPAIRGFRADVETVLPEFRGLFEAAAVKYDLPWTLLAALAYQESGWNPAAMGPRGTAGMMMLAAGTARIFGVTDPLDPAQSIDAGAGYLARMSAAIPHSVTGADRIWFALAAYNIGLAHMKDAYALAARLGKNPDRWTDLREVLPLLSEERYQASLRYGFARGAITVEHVRSVRNYEDMLEAALGAGRPGQREGEHASSPSSRTEGHRAVRSSPPDR